MTAPVVIQHPGGGQFLQQGLEQGIGAGQRQQQLGLEREQTEAGIAAPLLLMQSNGGVSGAPVIRRVPALTALSGPAAGVADV